jgi:squalene-hopene/tetraprenyl-beta-curcumene cyclase
MAATYLDEREMSWIVWPAAAREQNTFCISCHTVLPYALARPALRRVLAEQQPTEYERKIINNVERRVSHWGELGPYYTEEGYGRDKPTQSRGTEAVLNALILATADASSGHLSDTTRIAFTEMWERQLSSGDDKGAWPWLQFNMEPWEAADSQYYGAALAAIATGTAPENYRSSTDIQVRLRLLRDYLTGNAAKESMMNRVVLLWASAKLSGLLDSTQQQSIVQEIFGAQEADGGWELSSHTWPGDWSLRRLRRTYLRTDWTRQNMTSDSYATGLIAFVLQAMGISHRDPRVERALVWLMENQNSGDGSWPSVSLSVHRNSSSNVGHFMSDAATAYAVLALTERETGFYRLSQAKSDIESFHHADGPLPSTSDAMFTPQRELLSALAGAIVPSRRTASIVRRAFLAHSTKVSRGGM